MLEPITPEILDRIRNPDFKRYAHNYLDIAEDFRAQILQFGLPISNKPSLTVFDERIQVMAAQGVVIANGSKSLSLGWVSPSCITCRQGMGTATFSISTQCPRDCFFCFNPNQEDYEELLVRKDDPAHKLSGLHEQGVVYGDLALTGGEPLLHKDETLAFFCRAAQLYPQAHTRLYTSGSFLDEGFLCSLQKAGLDEIRFSIKTDDNLKAQQTTLERIKTSRAFIPTVVVEMPVMPDELALMKELLLTLDGIGINGINLLELCFPCANTEEFARRGYEIKPEQFRVLYNYQYAGGLPIAGSEDACLLLLEFALQQSLRMGVHYCSLENKFSGQVYLQNISFHDTYPFCSFSQKDYFLKSAKVFGRDAKPVEAALKKAGLKRYRKDPDHQSLEFPPVYLERLRQKLPPLEAGVCYYIVEQREADAVLRELRIDYTTPQTIEIDNDI